MNLVLLLQMSQATTSVAEDAGNISVCVEVNDATLPFQRRAVFQIFTIQLSAGIP